MRLLTGICSGTVAGIVSSLVFTALHDLLISDIWAMLIPMLTAGAICGLFLGGTYALLVDEASIRSWMRFNFAYVAMFILLGICSVILFEPVTTVAALIEANAPPTALFSTALPFIVGFTIFFSALLGKIYAQNWQQYVAITVTCVTLMLLLGMNVSVIGLVFIPHSFLYLIVELLLLIVALDAVYLLVFVMTAKKSFVKGTVHADYA